MTVTIDDKKIVKTAKTAAILLVAAFVVVFLALSSKVFHFSESNPYQYQADYERLSAPEKGVAASMRKRGEVQSKVLGTNRRANGKGNGFFDEVEKIHRNK